MWTCPTGRLGCELFVLAANRSSPTKKTRSNGPWEVSLSAVMCRGLVANMVVPLCQLNGRRELGGGPGVYSKHHGIRSSRCTARHRLARKIRYSYLISAYSSAPNGKPHWKVSMHGMPVPTWFEWYARVDSNHRPFAPEANAQHLLPFVCNRFYSDYGVIVRYIRRQLNPILYPNLYRSAAGSHLAIQRRGRCPRCQGADRPTARRFHRSAGQECQGRMPVYKADTALLSTMRIRKTNSSASS